jgi:hypothetical protein
MSAVTAGSAAPSVSSAQIDVMGLAAVGSNPQGARTERVIETPAPRLQKEVDIAGLDPLLEVLATGSEQPPGDLKAQIWRGALSSSAAHAAFPSDSDVSAELTGRSAT